MKGADDGEKSRKWSPDDAEAALQVLALPELPLLSQSSNAVDSPNGEAALKRATSAEVPADVVKYVKRCRRASPAKLFLPGTRSAFPDRRTQLPRMPQTRSRPLSSTAVTIRSRRSAKAVASR